ncbi:MAG TPA: hypothetical protein VG518_08640, partial [Solirubrobacterales bacterium]|nr:hypothetical protein [Solirubrobacterales bacterium]
EPAPPSGRRMGDPILSISEVAASTPWSEETLAELARAPGGPFREKAGMLVARESRIHAWLEAEEGADGAAPPAPRPRLAG